jgi:hypothetical protein
MVHLNEIRAIWIRTKHRLMLQTRLCALMDKALTVFVLALIMAFGTFGSHFQFAFGPSLFLEFFEFFMSAVAQLRHSEESLSSNGGCDPFPMWGWLVYIIISQNLVCWCPLFKLLEISA